VQAAGRACDRYPEHAASDDWKAERQRLAEWLRARPKPVALFAAMDTRAHEAIDACAEAGLQVPHDVAVLGVDNDELICNGAIPTLSSIQRDTLSCGFLAAQLLDRQMRKGARRRQVLTYGASRIVTRDSTQTGTAPADLVASRAREFIRINAGERIGVPDVVRHLNVSRRLAELRFRAAFGTSLLEEIRSARLERVRRLLAETDLSLAEICSRCDYQTDIHLRRLFKAASAAPCGSTGGTFRADARAPGTQPHPPAGKRARLLSPGRSSPPTLWGTPSPHPPGPVRQAACSPPR
jgi:LacI family transcriptional regulator